MVPNHLSDLSAAPRELNHVRNLASSGTVSAEGVESMPEQSDPDDDEMMLVLSKVATSAFVPDTQNLYVLVAPPSEYVLISLP